MAKEYKVNVDGREIIYLFKSSEDSVFQWWDERWLVLHMIG